MGVTPSNHRQNLELPQINFLSGSSSYSTKAQTTSTIINTVFGALLSVGTAAVAGGFDSKEPTAAEAAQMKANAEIASLGTPAGSGTALNAEMANLLSAEKKLAEIVNAQNGTTDQEVKSMQEQINGIDTKVIVDEGGTKKTIDIANVLSSLETAKTGLERLNQQKTIDESQMNTLQETVNSYKSAQAIKLPSGTSINPEMSAEVMQQTYAGDSSKYDVTTPPQAPVKEKLTQNKGESDADFKTRQDSAETNYDKAKEKFKKDSQSYMKYLEYQNMKASVDALAQQKQQVDKEQKTLDELKKKYGDGGAYNTTKAQYEAEISKYQEIINKNPAAVANAERKNNLSQEKALLEAQLQSYKPQKQTVTTTEGGKQVTKEVSTGPDLNATIRSLNEYIKEQKSLVADLTRLKGLSQQLEGQEKLDNSLNKNDGNWLTRLFSKKGSIKRTNRTTRKTNQGLIENTKKQVDTLARQILVKRQQCMALYSAAQ